MRIEVNRDTVGRLARSVYVSLPKGTEVHDLGPDMMYNGIREILVQINLGQRRYGDLSRDVQVRDHFTFVFVDAETLSIKL